MGTNGDLAIPAHFDRDKVGQVWRVRYQERADQARRWAEAHGIIPSADDNMRICLLLVDCQNTFCVPDFELFVSGRSGMGAVEDNVRLCEFIYRNLGIITEIHATMDTHSAGQIFHPLFWIDKHGRHPAPMTVITAEDVRRGAWKVNPTLSFGVERVPYERLERYTLHYVTELAARHKYELTIWPYHAMLGGIGHALVSSVDEAIFFHTIARRSQAGYQIKGRRALTEHYSVLKPEVLTDHEGNPVGQKNTLLLEHLLTFDAVFIAGQAKSHCVAWTIADLLQEVPEQQKAWAEKVYLLDDCTSPVMVPGVVDFTEHADAAFRRFAEAGMHLVKSTDRIEPRR